MHSNDFNVDSQSQTLFGRLPNTRFPERSEMRMYENGNWRRGVALALALSQLSIEIMEQGWIFGATKYQTGAGDRGKEVRWTCLFIVGRRIFFFVHEISQVFNERSNAKGDWVFGGEVAIHLLSSTKKSDLKIGLYRRKSFRTWYHVEGRRSWVASNERSPKFHTSCFLLVALDGTTIINLAAASGGQEDAANHFERQTLCRTLSKPRLGLPAVAGQRRLLGWAAFR